MRQCEVLDAYVAAGCTKGAAARLNVSLPAVSDHMTRIKDLMHQQTRFQALLQWDRYRRGERDQRWGVAV